MGDVARSHKTIACRKNEHLPSNNDLEFPGEDIIRFILSGMRMTGDAYPRSSTHLQEAVCSSGVCTRQTHGADAHVKVKPLGSRLIFDGRGSPVSVARVYRRPFV